MSDACLCSCIVNAGVSMSLYNSAAQVQRRMETALIDEVGKQVVALYDCTYRTCQPLRLTST